MRRIAACNGYVAWAADNFLNACRICSLSRADNRLVFTVEGCHRSESTVTENRYIKAQ